VVLIVALSVTWSFEETWLKWITAGLTWKNGSTSASRPSETCPRGSLVNMLIRLEACPRLFCVWSVAWISILRAGRDRVAEVVRPHRAVGLLAGHARHVQPQWAWPA